MSMRVSLRLAFVSMLAVGLLGVTLAARQTASAGSPDAARIKNPVPSTPESVAAGKKVYDVNCAGCHGPKAEGAEKAGITLSVIEDQGGKQPPDLTDDKWDHGSSDGEIFATITKGVGPQFFMAPFAGRIPDPDIWNTINYLRSLAKK
jgi:mono/diheme cytochrome c family protein